MAATATTERGPGYFKRERAPHTLATGASVVPWQRRPLRYHGGGFPSPKVKEAPARRPWGPQSSRRRPSRPCGRRLNDPKTKSAPMPLQRGAEWSQSEGGPHAHAIRRSMIQTRRLAPAPLERGPWCSQSKGGPHALVEGSLVDPKQMWPPRPCGGGLGDPNTMDAPAHLRRGLGWSQRETDARAHAVKASVDPKRRSPPRSCGGGLDDPNAKEAPKPLPRALRWYQSERGPRAKKAGASVVNNGGCPCARAAGASAIPK